MLHFYDSFKTAGSGHLGMLIKTTYTGLLKHTLYTVPLITSFTMFRFFIDQGQLADLKTEPSGECKILSMACLHVQTCSYYDNRSLCLKHGVSQVNSFFNENQT